MLANLHRRADTALCGVEFAAMVVAGIAVVAAMFLVSADALLRYLFAAPLAFQLHVSEFYLLPASMMMAMAWGYRTGGAIQITMLISSLPQRLAAVLLRLLLAVSAIYMAYLTWRSFLVFERALRRNEVVMGVIDWPVSLSWVWIFAGCGLLALRLAMDAIAPRLRPIGLAHE